MIFTLSVLGLNLGYTRSNIGLCPWDLPQARGYIWPDIHRLIHIHIHILLRTCFQPRIIRSWQNPTLPMVRGNLKWYTSPVKMSVFKGHNTLFVFGMQYYVFCYYYLVFAEGSSVCGPFEPYLYSEKTLIGWSASSLWRKTRDHSFIRLIGNCC